MHRAAGRARSHSERDKLKHYEAPTGSPRTFRSSMHALHERTYWNEYNEPGNAEQYPRQLDPSSPRVAAVAAFGAPVGLARQEPGYEARRSDGELSDAAEETAMVKPGSCRCGRKRTGEKKAVKLCSATPWVCGILSCVVRQSVLGEEWSENDVAAHCSARPRQKAYVS